MPNHTRCFPILLMGKHFDLLKQSVFYLVSNSIASAIPILLLPLVTEKLTPAEYGIWTSYLLLSNLALPFIGLGSDSSLNTFYFKMGRENFKYYLSNVLLLVFVTSVLLIILFLFNSERLESWFEIPARWNYLVIVYLLLFQICEILLIILRLHNKSGAYGIFKISRVVLEVSILLILIFGYSFTWEAMVLSQLFSFCIFSFIAILFLKRLGLISFTYRFDLIRKAVSYGLPIIPHVIGSILIGITDRWFILHYFGLAEMGLYSVGLQIGMVMSLLQNSFNQAWVPWLFGRLKSIESKQKLEIVKLSYLYMVGLLALAFGLTLILPELLKKYLSSQYEGAAIFIFWILIGYAFNGMYKIVVNYLFYLEQTKLIGIITIFTSILNIAFNYVFIRINGPIGASQATCLAFLVQFLLIWFYSAKAFPMPWNLKSKSPSI